MFPQIFAAKAPTPNRTSQFPPIQHILQPTAGIVELLVCSTAGEVKGYVPQSKEQAAAAAAAAAASNTAASSGGAGAVDEAAIEAQQEELQVREIAEMQCHFTSNCAVHCVRSQCETATWLAVVAAL